MYFCASDTESENLAEVSAGTLFLAAPGGARLGSGSALCFGFAGGATGGCDAAVLSGAGAWTLGVSAGGVLSEAAVLSGIAILSGAGLFAGAGDASAGAELGGVDDGVVPDPADVSGALESVGSEG